MNADKRELINDLPERVLGAVFEVANTLGAGFLEKVYERGSTSRVEAARHCGCLAGSVLDCLQRAVCRGVLRRYPCGQRTRRRTEMCRPSWQRAHGPMPELPACLRHHSLSSREL